MNVSFRDYEGIPGFGAFGASSQQDVENLTKALSAGVQYPPTSDGNVLRVQSLEATLRIVTFRLQNIKMWKKVPKLPAFSTVEEYNILSAYGADAGAFNSEGELPESQDSSYSRSTALVKFLGTTREVTHPMTMVRPAHGNVIALETQNGAIWLLERLERALFAARSDNIPVEFDGLSKQGFDGVGITDPNTMLYDATGVIKAGQAQTTVIDKRGATLSEDDIEAAANYVQENYGQPTDLFLAPRALSDLAKAFYPRQRVTLPPPVEGRVGFAVTEAVTSAGLISFNPDIFLRSGRNNGVKTPPAAATSPKAPNACTGVFGAAAPSAKSMFTASDAGAYFYRVSAVNRYGESTSSADIGAVTFAAGDAATLTITDGGGSYPATAYNIYRSAKAAADGTAAKLVATVKKPGGAITWVDYNWFIPGTSKAYMLQNDMHFWSFRQLAPMMKIPLATIAASIRWMQLLYGTPIVYAPLKMVQFVNVSDG